MRVVASHRANPKHKRTMAQHLVQSLPIDGDLRVQGVPGGAATKRRQALDGLMKPERPTDNAL